MIFNPLPVKFLPQKKLLIWAKNSPIFCSKLPRNQKWRYQKFLLHQKMAKEGSKNQFFFRKNIRKMGKTNFGTSGTIISFFENLPRVLPHAPEQFMRVSYGLEGPRRPGMSKKVAVVLATECQHADARIPSTRFRITPPTLITR